MFINGVSIVVARVEGVPYGMSIAWATQVEAEHLIVSLPRDSVPTAKVRAAGCFTVNILVASQRALALRFGSAGEPGGDLAGSKFEGVDYAVKGEAVVLAGCHRAIFCDLESTQAIGKQLVVVGLIRRSDLSSGDVPPLSYKRVTTSASRRWGDAVKGRVDCAAIDGASHRRYLSMCMVAALADQRLRLRPMPPAISRGSSRASCLLRLGPASTVALRLGAAR